jgi:hypothetical protein
MNFSLNNLNVLHSESLAVGSETHVGQTAPTAPASTTVSGASGIDLDAVSKYVIGNPGAIQLKGMDAMQNVSPKDPNARQSGSDGPSISPECSDGFLANATKAVGATLGSEYGPSGEEFGSRAGQALGALACEQQKAFGDAAKSLSDTGPDNDSFSYDDPETGERITNDRTSTGDWSTTAGDPSAPKGEYIGEADDPNFVNAGTEDSSKNQSTNADNNSNQSSTSSTDTNSPQSTQQSSDNNSTQSTDNVNETLQNSDPAGPKPGGNNLPADDSSGNTGPAGPRANIYQNVASAADFMPADDSTGNPGPAGPRSNINNSVETVTAQNLALNAALTRGIIIVGG